MLTTLGRLSPTVQRIILVLGCAVLFGLWLTSVPLTEIDETRYTEATREMLESRNYIIPYFNYEPRYRKPILYYWIQAASVKAFGLNEVAARLPSAAATTLTVLAVHGFLLYWLRKRAGKEPVAQQEAGGAAFLGGVACATTLFAVVWGRAATTDATLTMFMTLSTLALLQAALVDAPRRWYLVAAVAAGLAFLTKGPIGIVLPGMTWLLFHLRQKTLMSEAKRVPWISAVALFVLVAAPWYVATYVVDGSAFLRHFFMQENVARFSSTAMEGHGTSNRLLALLIYPLVALVFLFPYSGFLAHDLIKPSFSASDDVLFRIRRFAWAWMAAVIGIFSISKTQLPSYIHSVIGAAGILFALYVFGLCSEKRKNDSRTKWAVGVETVIVFLIGLALTAGIIAVFKHGSIKGRMGEWPFPHPAVDTVIVVMAAAGVIMLLAMIISRFSRKPGDFAAWTVGSWAAFLCTTMLVAAPLIVRTVQGPSRTVGSYLRDLPKDEPVYVFYGDSPENMIYYSRRKIVFRNTAAKAAEYQIGSILSDKHRVIVVADAESIKKMERFGRVNVVRSHGPIVIARVKELPR